MGEDQTLKQLAVLILTLCLAAAHSSETESQSLSHRNLDSLARLHFLEISKLEPPALAARRRVRRELQRRCYADVLLSVCVQDGLSAILALLRGEMHIEFSISHRPLVPGVPRKENGEKLWDIPEIDDWTFPANPWEKKTQ